MPRRSRSIRRYEENPILSAPTSTAGQIAAGFGMVAVPTAIGAVVGAATNEPCSGQTMNLFCGPATGAFFGAGAGTVVGGAAGLGVAVFSPSWRTAGLTAVGVVVALAIASRIKGAAAASAPPAQSSGPTVPTHIDSAGNPDVVLAPGDMGFLTIKSAATGGLDVDAPSGTIVDLTSSNQNIVQTSAVNSSGISFGPFQTTGQATLTFTWKDGSGKSQTTMFTLTVT